MIILFPSEPFSPKEVDSSFKAEYEAAKTVGFEVFLFDHDEMAKTGHLISNLPYNHGADEMLILRSWMLKHEHYVSLEINLLEKNYTLINDTEKYLNCHYFVNALPVIYPYTSRAYWTLDWENMMHTDRINWKPVRDYLGGDVIIKDYVKSEKGNSELFILEKELKNHEFHDRVLKFVEARGKQFNRGIVFKQIESLKKYDEQTNEWRMFFVNGKLTGFGFNSAKLVATDKPSPSDMVKFIGLAGNVKSNFFTMDIAEKEDGSWMILELGDGQVSGLAAHEEPIAFYNNMHNLLHGIEV